MNSCEPEDKKDRGCKLFEFVRNHFKNHCIITKFCKKIIKKKDETKTTK